jgi:hypothetical protein
MWKKGPQYPLDKRLCVPQWLSKYSGEEKNSVPLTELPQPKIMGVSYTLITLKTFFQMICQWFDITKLKTYKAVTKKC